MLTVAAAVALFTGGIGVVAHAAPAAPGVIDQVDDAAGAPCVVTGYSWHARQEMAAENITSDYVEQVVLNTCHSAKWQKGNKTWKYTTGRGGLSVVANGNGYVVTVWRN
ncbi:hypothetical protein BJY24_001413 [Nocardia transvalensis]|uniref:Uncharacterized protein n=1 Tax=Nocardia transvalensis TaxID=37333 RepID=A0A7W9PAR6_9NOCA|nr:DUF4258 domain-containing protein [Nocardia transvalensis]MBB5912546.1 hypothetical protein [Nocardia transvalensis]